VTKKSKSESIKIAFTFTALDEGRLKIAYAGRHPNTPAVAEFVINAVAAALDMDVD
jgi:hypothetical protein